MFQEGQGDEPDPFAKPRMLIVMRQTTTTTITTTTTTITITTETDAIDSRTTIVSV